jgi:hypothetical protein
MAGYKGFRTSARTTAGTIEGSDTIARRVFMYVVGEAEQRIGFAEEEVTQAGSGFLIPEDGGIEFVLDAGDDLWMSGHTSADISYVYVLITKVA